MLESIFTDEITEFIIVSVHAEEYLWNPTNPLYKLRHMKNDFWQKLTEDINIKYKPCVQIRQADVCRKWNNLKSYYKHMHQKTRKAQQRVQNDNARDDLLLDWKNKSKMDFLLQLETSTQPINKSLKRSPSELELSDESSFHTEDSFCGNDLKSPMVVIDLEDEFEEPAARSSAVTSSPAKPLAEASAAPKRKRTTNYEDPMVISSVKSLSTEPNELFHYGNFIVESIRRLDRDLQIQAKKLLTNVILELEMEQDSRDIANRSSNLLGK